MFRGLRDKAVTMALNGVKNAILEQYLENIGKVEELVWKDGRLVARMRLEGLEEPVLCECAEITAASDGSSVTINKFTANPAFIQTALNRFVAGKPFAVPAGGAQLAVKTARKILGLQAD